MRGPHVRAGCAHRGAQISDGVLDNFRNRLRGIEFRVLRYDGKPNAFARRNCPGIRLLQPSEDLDESAFARAVWTDETDTFPVRYGE